MDHGRVQQLGTPEELYDAPRTRFVAGFIGTTNLLTGTIEGVEPAGAVVLLEGGERCMAASGMAAGTPVDLAIRPEAISIGPDDPSAEPAGPVPPLRGHVLQSAYLGMSVSHQVRTDGGLVLSIVVPRSAERPAQGDRVRLDWEPSDVLVMERAEAPQTHEEERP
jgi:spermidine/putrescine transport system ATP-binding protein